MIGAGWRHLTPVVLIVALLVVAIPPAVEAASVNRAAPVDEPGSYDIRGRGFTPGEDVSLRLIGPSGQEIKVGRDSASDGGTVRFKIRVPRFYEPGQWTVRLRGQISDKDAEATISVPLRLPNLTMTVVPSTASSGTVVAVTGDGFDLGETISWWATGPDGQTLSAGNALADDTGRFELLYRVPPGIQPGVWQFSAYGQRSDNQGIVPFTVPA